MNSHSCKKQESHSLFSDSKSPRIQEQLMADAHGFDDYSPFSDTAGFVFYNANDSSVDFFNLHPQHHPNLALLTHLHLPAAIIPQPITILSASWGYILFRDALNSYHFLAPFANPLFGHDPLPNLHRPHANNTPAVIARSLHTQHFHAICAIDEGHGNYTFDTWSTTTGNWSHARGPIDLGGHNIILNTGVSCNLCAYWLTDGQMPVVIRHDPQNHLTMILEGGGALNNIVGPERRGLQLGCVRGQLAIVVLRVDWSADLYVLAEGNRWQQVFSDMIIAGQVDDHVQVEALRFESYKVEILFCVGPERRLLLWEFDREFNGTRVRELENIWGNEPDIANGVPCIHPCL